jgi:uncharacterized protein (DUF1697 family)
MTYVALLRGINVGGNNKVEMKKLKATFESLGFTDVLTYINSGNVIFTSDKKSLDSLALEIEEAIEKVFSLTIRVLVRDSKNIQKLIQVTPTTFSNDESQRTDVLFLWDEFDSKKTLGIIKHNPKVDTLLYTPGAIVWSIKRTDYTRSGMHDLIKSPVYKKMTGRNINTVRKIAELMRG